MGFGMTWHTFHAITSPIRALNPLGFLNTTRSDRHVLTHPPSDHEPHSSRKATRIPKYNAERSFSLTCATTCLSFCFLSSFEIQKRFSDHIVFRIDLKNLPFDHKPDSSITSARTPKYNVERTV
ncbi:uncharacterized protein G2W53_040327 [Senna tora]|uniref:Uncharacterized protein n=1 Tax=Senna tora TaxID=362788 RepID=A0A834SRG4_9FABA|nr:uncharacterized protein G2W53_040327 [Senna tora]